MPCVSWIGSGANGLKLRTHAEAARCETTTVPLGASSCATTVPSAMLRTSTSARAVKTFLNMRYSPCIENSFTTLSERFCCFVIYDTSCSTLSILAMRTAGFTYNQRCGKYSLVGWLCLPVEQVNQHLRCHAPQGPNGLANRGQGWVGGCGGRQIIKADDADIVGCFQPAFRDGAQRSQRHHVAGT